MADKPEIEDAATYQVRLKRKVPRPNGMFLMPNRPTRVRGDLLRTILVDVSHYEPVSK